MAENHHHDRFQPSAPSGLPVRWRTVLFLFLATSLFFWRLTLTNQYTWIDSGDISGQVLPWFQFQVGEIQQGRLPLWDPYPFGGQPLIGQAQPGAAYPLNWLLFLMPTRHGWIRQSILHWYFVLIHFMAVAFAYKLCRDQRHSDPAAVLGGLVFGLGGYMGYLDWPQMMNGAVWTPLVLMFLLRVERGERVWASAALGGLCLGVSLLSGHHQVPTFVGLASVGIWCWLIFGAGRGRELWRPAALFAIVAALASGLQALPAWEYSRHAVRWVGTETPVDHAGKVPYYIHTLYSFIPVNVLGIAIPGLDPTTGLYVGVVAVCLTLFAVALAWRHSAVRIALALLLAALVYSFGGHTVFHGIFYSLAPLAEKARSPLMATAVASACLALLVSFGVEALLEEHSAHSAAASVWTRRVRWTLAGFAALILTGMWTVYMAQRAWHNDVRPALAAEAALGLVALLAAWDRRAIGPRALTTALGLLVFLELGNGKVSLLPHKLVAIQRAPVMASDTPWVKEIRNLGPNVRFQLSNEERPHNFGDWNGVDVWHSYLASLTTNVYRSGIHEGRTRELFGVRYFVGVKQKPTVEWNEVVGQYPAGFTIYLNRNALPRAFAVHEVVSVKNHDEGRRLLENGSFDLRRKAFLEGRAPGGVEKCAPTVAGSDDVHIIRRVSDRVRLWADLDCAGLVVLSDTYYPGWTATVDGRPAEIHQVYSVIRGVVVPKGKHWVEMSYRPWSVYLGLAMTLTGLGLALVVSRRDRGRL